MKSLYKYVVRTLALITWAGENGITPELQLECTKDALKFIEEGLKIEIEFEESLLCLKSNIN